MKWHLAGVFGMILLETSHGTESLPPLKETPKNIEEVWSGYEPALEPIAARVVREWEEGGCTLRYILYSIGHFKGKPAIMAGFYGFPSGQKDFPAVMHMHGGATSLSSDRQAVCETRLRSLVRQLGRPPHGRRPSRRSQHRLGSRQPNAKQCPWVFQPLTQREEYRSLSLGTKQQLVLADRRMPAWHHLSRGAARSGCRQYRRVRSFNGRTPDRSGGRDRSTRQSHLPLGGRERFFCRLIFGESPALHGV